MKYKLLAVGTEAETNIGDYIQALASSQFFPQIDGFIEREKLKEYNGDECNVIMNGWYMHNSKQWPPSFKINPLFVAVHFNLTVQKSLLSNESIAYLKQHEPIGCRDTQTRDILLEKGVKAYFSGCMTLTLGYKYKNNIKDDKIYFVDPYFFTNWNIVSIVKNLICLFENYSAISKISQKYPSYKNGLRKKMVLTTFYREYSKYFTKRILVDATYVCQQSSFYTTDFPTNEDRLREAERLVKLYAKARLVITSRIHCALPCIGLETPVIYTENAQQSEVSSCRLGGLRELFHILKWNNNSLKPEFEYSQFLDKQIIENKNEWKKISKDLIERCLLFAKK